MCLRGSMVRKCLKIRYAGSSEFVRHQDRPDGGATGVYYMISRATMKIVSAGILAETLDLSKV
jgi:hypothetical protein